MGAGLFTALINAPFQAGRRGREREGRDPAINRCSGPVAFSLGRWQPHQALLGLTPPAKKVDGPVGSAVGEHYFNDEPVIGMA